MTLALPLATVTETSIMREQLVALSEAFHPGGIFWRQSVGEAWAGKAKRLPDGSVLIRYPSRITFGVPGQGDIMGLLDGRFASIETKTETGTQRKTQENWEAAVRLAGGIYGICRTPAEAVSLLRETVRGT